MADGGIDIVVSSPTGHTDLVVVVTLQKDLADPTARLSTYMARVGAEAGLVVGPDLIRVLLETYRGNPSVQIVGDFPISQARGLRISSNVSEFEDGVQQWIEALQNGDDVAVGPLRTVLVEHVRPVIAEGTVRAAGPRSHVAAG